jgi:hypothetical protein
MTDTIISALDAKSSFRLQGRRYLVGDVGMRALNLIALLVDASGREKSAPSGFIRYRRQVRECLHPAPRALLTYVAEQATNPALRRIAVWLRGRCRGNLGVATLARLWHTDDVGVRKEIIRALKRMDAWDYLRVIETVDSNPRIRRMARPSRRRAFSVRLSRFLARIGRHDAGQPAPLLVSENCEPGGGRPAKSSVFIRRILEHIRWLVRAPVDHR